jgi:copper chaperone CopZ
VCRMREICGEQAQGMKGGESVSVSYPTGSAAIEFDPAVVTLQQLQKAIQDAGYKTHTT